MNWYKTAQENSTEYSVKYFTPSTVILSDHEAEALMTTQSLGPYTLHKLFPDDFYAELFKSILNTSDNTNVSFDDFLTNHKVMFIYETRGAYYATNENMIYLPTMDLQPMSSFQAEKHILTTSSPYIIFHEIGHWLAEAQDDNKYTKSQEAFLTLLKILAMIFPWWARIAHSPGYYSQIEIDADKKAILAYLDQVRKQGEVLEPSELKELLQKYLKPGSIMSIVNRYTRELEQFSEDVIK